MSNSFRKSYSIHWANQAVSWLNKALHYRTYGTPGGRRLMRFAALSYRERIADIAGDKRLSKRLHSMCDAIMRDV